MIQTLEDMIRRICAYGLEFKDSDGFTHDWHTLIPTVELAYETSIHSSAGKAAAMLEEGWKLRLPSDTLKKDLVGIHPTASRFKLILAKANHHANRFMQKKDGIKFINHMTSKWELGPSVNSTFQ
ncbi:hypothetical protein O181_075266 [Austropuccinia psidii MF-1]|uniref:Uncharacterized protein n=1 Tax=Austropuccinia psidii MF-1 TaxID=1389203 RepID=A0A9Q3FEB6_9BASI|nr:hypothetical protein [Austropuccinia psidii MF-1]